MKISYAEENDADFIRWTSNLLRCFIDAGEISIVKKGERPDILIASVWRKHKFPSGIPVVLISNENWQLFKPHVPLRQYQAVLGVYAPSEPCAFIQYPYSAVHFDVPVEELYNLRTELLKVQKTGFCCFVTSNRAGDLAAQRIALFERINRWRRVDSGGALLNNLQYRPPRGIDFLYWIAKYKYMICVENSRAAEYITEKPFQAWFAGTVPIYDGGCVSQLNRDAIVDASSSQVLQELELLESSPDLYESKRRAPLSDTRLSLANFEQQFRAIVLNTVQFRADVAPKCDVTSGRRLARFFLPRE